MRNILTPLFLVILSSAGLSAQASEALADKNACLNCHGVNNKIVGPAFADIAAKYKDRKDAAAYMTEKIAKGSSGVWGQIPMPGMPQLAADEVKSMVSWVLALPPKK
jgi:cytochrome c